MCEGGILAPKISLSGVGDWRIGAVESYAYIHYHYAPLHRYQSLF